MAETYIKYKHIDYTLAPSGLYVGWTYYDNGIYYASHRTVDKCVDGVKHQLYLQKKVSTRGYTVATSPTPREQAPIDKMKQAFLTRAYWGAKTTGKLTPEQADFHKKVTTRAKTEKPATVENNDANYDYYDYRLVDNKVIIIGCKKIAEYDLEKPAVLPDTDKPVERPTLHLPLGD